VGVCVEVLWEWWRSGEEWCGNGLGVLETLRSVLGEW
jgi:hypothetical protein